jgi:molecular chaperone DnaK
MKREAEANADTDKRAHELADARNIAEQTIYAADKALAEHGAKIPDDMRTSIQASITALKQSRDTGDTDGIRTATQALSNEMMKIGQHIQTQAGAKSDEGGGQKPPEGPVTDV